MKTLNEKINENKELNIKVELKWSNRYGRNPELLFSELIIECTNVLNSDFNFDLNKKEVIEYLEKSVKFLKETDKF